MTRRIVPVPARQQAAALTFLLVGDQDHPWATDQAQAYLTLYRQCAHPGSALWWCLDGDRPQAVALVLASAGRVGFVYFSPPDAPGVDPDALTELLHAISAETLRTLHLLQIFLSPKQASHSAFLRTAGFEDLAELISLECPLAGLALPTEPWQFVRAGQIGTDGVKALLTRTYEGSLDCPKLAGVRPLDDILASHRSSGHYQPNWWQVALDANQTPAGLILLNRTLQKNQAEVVYMGVVPEFRGRGVGTALLGRAAQLAQGPCAALRVSVDAANSTARALYNRIGFLELHRRQVLARFSTASTNNL